MVKSERVAIVSPGVQQGALLASGNFSIFYFIKRNHTILHVNSSMLVLQYNHLEFI